MISSNKSGNCRLVKKLTQHPQQVSSEPGFNSRQLDSSASPLLREGRAKSYSQGSEVETAFTGQDDLSGLTSNEDVTKDLLYCNLSLAWTTKVFSILFLEQATLIFPSHFEGQNSYSSKSNHHWRICCVRVALSRQQGSSTQRPNTLRNITRGCTEMDSSFANHS